VIKYQGDASTFMVGMGVEGKGVQNADGTVIADKIEVQ
jgi:hypothetical protein